MDRAGGRRNDARGMVVDKVPRLLQAKLLLQSAVGGKHPTFKSLNPLRCALDGPAEEGRGNHHTNTGTPSSVLLGANRRAWPA
jgi:hypothetical protein